MASIYNISSWGQGSVQYKRNDIVKYSGDNRYWYAKSDHTSTATNYPQIGSALWVGTAQAPASTHSNPSQIIAPYFSWKPAYNMTVNHEPTSTVIKFGDGYEQRLKTDINNDLIKMNLSFEGRDLREAAAILHFLDSRQGVDFFFFRPPQPYDLLKKFICKSFSTTVAFQNNLNISATFEQVP
tara:strand:- start:471 stop:1019 length:549 start_codon:yes stop_codon:yes gene_type:complete